MTQDLYTTLDVKKVKEILYKEQQGKCAMTGIAFPIKDFHTDHAHDDEQLVRAALYKQSNMALGKLEGLWTRYLAYWYPHTLPEFLRQAAAYLERSNRTPETRWRHPGWQKKLTVLFNRLPAVKQNLVLKLLCDKQGTNPAARKKLWSTIVKDRTLGYNTILKTLKGANNA